MKQIVFNGSGFDLKRMVGITRHSYEVLSELDKIVEPGRVSIFAPLCGFDFSGFKNISVVKMGKLTHDNRLLSRACGICWKYFYFPLFCLFKNAVSVNTFLAWKGFSFDVISIYDTTTEMFYNNYDFNKKTDYTVYKWRTALIKKQKRKTKNCRMILTDSYSAKKDIMAYYNVSEDKITVTYCGWQHFSRINEDEGILKKLGLERREYFFSLGSRMPHKNIKWVTAAAKMHPNYCFVVTGNKDFQDTSFEGEIPANMVFSGYLKDEEIKALMKHCRAFIQPSLYEGFGIPPLEAMSVGADCMVSDIPAFREIYKNSVWYFDPLDYDNIVLDKIMSRPKDSNEKILDEFRWEKSAKKMWDVLRELAR